MTDLATGRRSVPMRVLRTMTTIEVGIAGLAAALIFVLVLVQAGQRYLPVDGWPWTGELARYGLVWLTFTATGVLVTRDGHISLQLVDSIPSAIIVRLIRIAALLVVAVIGGGFAWACWSLIEESGSITTPAMGIPMSWIYVLPFLGFVSTAIRASISAALVAITGSSPDGAADTTDGETDSVTSQRSVPGEGERP